MLKRLFLGSNDGKNFIVTNDKDELPPGARPVPVNSLPTPEQSKFLAQDGGSVTVILKDLDSK